MSGKRSYLPAAFNARPLGMPVPPNWFALAAFALLGGLVHPGFWLIGVGLEGAYLWALSRNPRFRVAVDASRHEPPDWQGRYEALAGRLDPQARRAQEEIEQQAGEVAGLLRRTGAIETQIAGVTQMAWLHLRLLAARSALAQVIGAAARERDDLAAQERRLGARLAAGDADEALRRSLEQQLEVIRSRRGAHADAERRIEVVEAELERLRQQLALVREQSLLASDEGAVASTLDALAASLNEANRWLRDQRELFAGLDDLTEEAPPIELLRTKRRAQRQRVKGESA